VKPTKPIGKHTKLQLERLYVVIMKKVIDIFVRNNDMMKKIVYKKQEEDDECPICLESTKGQKHALLNVDTLSVVLASLQQCSRK